MVLVHLGQVQKIPFFFSYSKFPKSKKVVTGASDGIGKAFAEDLAKRGFNIVLIARNQQKLDEVAESISKFIFEIFDKNLRFKIK